MQTIKVKKTDLIDVLKRNLSEHRDAFLEAQKKYREVVIQTLDQELARVRNGEPFVMARLTCLVQPTDHTEDYKRVIGMLEMDISETVDLSGSEYACYVDDNWGWMGQFANEVTSYGVSNAKLSKHVR